MLRALSSVRLLYSQTYWGQPQKCTGLDQLLLARGPWEDEPILIRGISLTHRVYPPADDAFAMAGSSAVDGDILAHVSGSGTSQIMYPKGTGFLFPGRPASCHIDVHAWYFTPASASAILGALQNMGLSQLTVHRVYATRYGAFEFWMILRS